MVRLFILHIIVLMRRSRCIVVRCVLCSGVFKITNNHSLKNDMSFANYLISSYRAFKEGVSSLCASFQSEVTLGPYYFICFFFFFM